MFNQSVFLADAFPAASMIFVFAVVVFFVISNRLMAGSLDRDRIEKYLRDHGFEPLEIQWEPFGLGWWGEKNDRIYQVRYRHPDGNARQAWCKTSRWGGVFLSDDDAAPSRPARTASISKGPASTAEQLERENQKLREELERLKRDRELNER